MRVPVSTYRVQTNNRFPFREVRAIADYLESLGVGDIYCSPVLKARSGSPHCYDVVDHSVVNPELGGEEALDELVSTLRAGGMGLLLDIVPNHMSASTENPYWMDVLEYGGASPYARMFDIDWGPQAKALRGKVLLPILDRPLAEAIASKRVGLALGKGSRPFVIRVGEDELPVSPSSYLRIYRLLESASGTAQMNSPVPSVESILCIGNARERRSRFESVKRALSERLRSDARFRSALAKTLAGSPSVVTSVLGSQNYLLAHWKDADTRINYRRFLDVNELVALRVDDLAVFRMTHRVVLDLLRTGRVQGLRVDHADGLLDPALYFRRLKSEVGPLVDPYVPAEKILQRGKKLPSEWEVSGTTGYGFMNELNRLYVKAENGARFDTVYRRFTSNRDTFEESVYKGKLLAAETMRSDLRRLASLLKVAYPSADERRLEAAIREVAARFGGYRVYISPRSRSVRRPWRRRIEGAISRAQGAGIDGPSLTVVKSALLLRSLPPERRWARLEFVLRFQQFTASLEVKGEEDTALYRYNRLTSLNEVGGDPQLFGEPIALFHGHNLERLRDWPHAMVSTSTHDTKRSEDVRARLNVLSEIPDEWEGAIWRWRDLTLGEGGRRRNAPSPNDEYLFYQTLLGAWPHSPKDYTDFVERMVAYMRKATKEERLETSWTRPDMSYERALESYVRGSLRRGNRFNAALVRLERKVDWFGMLNSLSQILVKLTVPGVPDIYQGNELWDYSLVDPDNRRPVDFEIGRKMLKELDGVAAIRGRLSAARASLEDLPSGRAKLYVTAAALRYRASNRDLFRVGGYIPLDGAGPRSANLIAYSRVLKNVGCVVCAPRFFTELCQEGKLPLGLTSWRRTVIVMKERRWARYADVFTGREVRVREQGGRPVLAASEIFSDFPLGLLQPL